jgi:hypothetical protein
LTKLSIINIILLIRADGIKTAAYKKGEDPI